ncbi:MAG: tetratricopeptide repeat protein [Coriobacteriia bacterium]|nr:tetratricopeptide repeat protein [Coriobacteriia bacterium]
MDDTRIAAADAAYAAGDWTTAAREYLAATAGRSEGSGYGFHRAGNALMKLRRFDDACAVYERALEDGTYSDESAVACNLGTARATLGSFSEAAPAFERALTDGDYAGRYKALQGLAGAFYQMGRLEEAADAYRKAALDDRNPDPGKALNNLGLCFIALERPEDAVGAYRAALDMPGYKGRGRAAANLGMAYAALGMHDLAIASFERARDEFGYSLTTAMEAAYRSSLKVDRGSDRVEGWSTGEMSPAFSEPAERNASVPDADESEDVSRFFTITDAEMRAADRDARRRERLDERQARPLWLTLVTWGSVVVVIAGILVGAYLYGVGYPTQQMTVLGMMEAYGAGEAVDSYWVAVPARDVDKAMSSLPPAWTSYEIVRVVRAARTSKADVAVVLEQGGTVTYEISLAREGVGWKVSGVASSFSSMDGGL